MYQLISTEDTLRIPAEYMRKGQSLDDHIDRLMTLALEGKFDEMNRFVVLTTHHEPIGRGRIIHGDGAVYQKVRFKAVVFTIEDLEVFEGAVSDMIQIGAFVRIGPMEALLHKSQIMDEMVDLNEGQNIIMARNSGKRLEVGKHGPGTGCDPVHQRERPKAESNRADMQAIGPRRPSMAPRGSPTAEGMTWP